MAHLSKATRNWLHPTDQIEPNRFVFTNPDLAREYQRWIDLAGNEQPVGPFSMSTADVLRSHFLLMDHFKTKGEGVGGVGPKSLHLLHSAVARQWAGFGGVSKWRNLTDVVATLFFGIIRNHAFHDANKRTALLTALYQLQCHNRVPDASTRQFEELTERTAKRALDEYLGFDDRVDDADVRFISDFFRRKTRKIDRRHYVLTYRQLDRLLRRFGARLEHPRANVIDVVQDDVSIHFFIKRQKTRRVLQIGFHDWGTEVNKKDIDAVRRELRLTPAAGVDSQVFFQGVDPLESLIAEYRAPLERLAFK